VCITGFSERISVLRNLDERNPVILVHISVLHEAAFSKLKKKKKKKRAVHGTTNFVYAVKKDILSYKNIFSMHITKYKKSILGISAVGLNGTASMYR
jgi:hypothetical protein